MRVSEEDMELWIGTDKRGDYPKQFVLEVLCEIANGEYEPEQLKLDVLDMREYKDKTTAIYVDNKAKLKYTYSTKGFIKWFPISKEKKL